MQRKCTIQGREFEIGTKGMEAEMKHLAGHGYNQVGVYQHSFGPLQDKSCYFGGMRESTDMRPLLESAMVKGMKSLSSTTGGAGTAGYALIPVYVDQRIVDQSRKYTPLVELIPRVTNMGMTADYNIITAKGGAVTAPEDSALSESNDTYDRQSVAIKFLYSVGRVTGPSQAAMPSYILEGFQPSGAGNTAGSTFGPSAAPNAKQVEVLMKARAMKELEENLIINGDASSDATQFSGIVVLQGTTNQLDLNSAPITWDDVETVIQYAFDDGGRPKLGIASSSVVSDLRKIMIDHFRMSPSDLGGEIVFGIPSKLILDTMVGPIPVLPSMYLSNTSGAKQIFFLDTDFIEMRVLQDMTYEDLAKTNDSNKFMLKIYECLIMRSTPFNSFIDNIA